MSETLVVGLDVGGTSTRAVVLTLTGERLGTGRAGGGNPTSHGGEQAAIELRTALRAALAQVDPGLVRAGTLGLAGAGRLLADLGARAAFDRVWREVGLNCPYRICGDALVAYVSGSGAPDGTILIAGTGAVAAQVRDFALERVADGHGWLLGDAGSGFWLGREAVHRTLVALDSGREPGRLGDMVLTEVLGSAMIAPRARDTVDALVQAVTRRPPVQLAALAPLVIEAAREQDPVALMLLDEAAEVLTASVARIRPPHAPDPIVLGGGLLTADTPLAGATRSALKTRWPAATVVTAGDGASAAAWLAACELPEVDDPVALHRRMVPPSTGS